MSSFILTNHYKINQYLYKSIIKIQFYGIGRIFISFHFIMICCIFLCDICLTSLFYDCVWKIKFYNLIIDDHSKHAWSLLRWHCDCFSGECMAIRCIQYYMYIYIYIYMNILSIIRYHCIILPLNFISVL